MKKPQSRSPRSAVDAEAGRTAHVVRGKADRARRPATAASTRPAGRQDKSMLHPRNRHRAPYDFPALAAALPELATFLRVGPYGETGIDFADPAAVKALNRALLLHFYGVKGWDIPDGFLCPPVPGRADYIHVLADLLGCVNDGAIPAGSKVSVLDIGTGANCIYPLLGHASYGWHFVASDVSRDALKSAACILTANPAMAGAIALRHQVNAAAIFDGVIRPEDRFDLTLCNPPFHTSAEAATEGSRRKVNNLHRGQHNAERAGKLVLNFGGQANELWCPGGELAFIRQMMKESRQFASQCCWFSSLISKKEHVAVLQSQLTSLGASRVKLVSMAQGQKQSRMLAWSFLDAEQLRQWRQDRW